MKRLLYPIILVVLTVLIAVLNHTPGTWLTGWDTLHPEADFGLNFGRLLQGVWRGEQGLGALAGHSHMADLPRVAILWLVHFFTPLSFVRYSYVFLCLIAGPLGIYYLTRFLARKSTTEMLGNLRAASANQARRDTSSGINSSKADPRHTNLPISNESVAFCTALFYLLNPGTVQQFYAPFEMFTTQWALLPWIILISLKYLVQKSSPKTLLIFALVTLFSAPMAYAAQLWHAFFVLYILFIFGYSAMNAVSVRKPLILLALTFTINSFWLLPNLYFVATGSSVPRESKQNRIFSQEYRLRNRQNGYISDVALLKGFYLDWPYYNTEKNDFGTLMPVWKDHMDKGWVKVIGFGMFAGGAAGMVLALARRSRIFIPFLPFVVIPAVLLLNRTWPFNMLFDYLLTFGLLEEALRFIFSKVSILLLFGYTVFFAYFLQYLFSKISALVRCGTVIIIAGILVTYAFPMFRGQLISPAFRIAVPDDYREFWNYMKTRPDGRVLSLPLHSFSGWVYHDWGYQGSGFLWFGLKQPLLDRDSDRWNSANEQAYREFHAAFYTGTPEDVSRTLRKYNIRYIVTDASVTAPSLKNTAQILYSRHNDSVLSGFRKKASFGSVSVYEAPQIKENKSDVQNVLPAYRWGYSDEAFKLFGTYISSPDKPALTFPFRNIESDTGRLDRTLIDADTGNGLYKISSSVKLNGTMTVPELADSMEEVAAGVHVSRSETASRTALIFNPLIPQGLIRSAEYEISIPAEKEFPVTVNGKILTIPVPELVRHDKPIYLGEVSLKLRERNIINGMPVSLNFERVMSTGAVQDLYLRFGAQPIRFTATDLAERVRDLNHMTVKQGHSDPRLYFEVSGGQAGTYIGLEQLAHDTGYIFVVRSRNLEGLPLRICLADLFSHICTVYDELTTSADFTDDYFLIQPTAQGIGYGLSLDNIAFGGMTSRNEIKEVFAIPIPSVFLSSLYAKPDDYKTAEFDSLYTSNSAYHPGYKLFDPQKPFSLLSGSPEHVLVNNWENGWIVDSNDGKHYIPVFLPQLLQYLGFGLAGGSILLTVLYLKRDRVYGILSAYGFARPIRARHTGSRNHAD